MSTLSRLKTDAAGYRHAKEELDNLRRVFGAILLKHGPLRIGSVDIAAARGTVSIATTYDSGTDEYIVEVLHE